MVLRVLFHPKQLTVISAGDEGEVRVWDLVTKACTMGECALRALRGIVCTCRLWRLLLHTCCCCYGARVWTPRALCCCAHCYRVPTIQVPTPSLKPCRSAQGPLLSSHSAEP